MSIIYAANELPDTVKLNFHQSIWRDSTPELKVRANDMRGKSITAIGDLAEMHRWLSANGYSWIMGSEALWTRTA